MTADFRERPLQTAQAHVGVLADLMQRYEFQTFLYLSSTRVYAGVETAMEDTSVHIQPANPDHLYNVTKLAGEALCLARGTPGWRVARLSNVIGPGDSPKNFLPSLISDARTSRRVMLRTAPDSSKDYIAVSDVVRAIERVALGGRHRIYNVASGRNTNHRTIADLLRIKFGAEVSYADQAALVAFPEISIARLVDEFGFSPAPFEDAFASACAQREEVL